MYSTFCLNYDFRQTPLIFLNLTRISQVSSIFSAARRRFCYRTRRDSGQNHEVVAYMERRIWHTRWVNRNRGAFGSFLTLPACGRVTVRNGRVASLISPGPQAGLRIDPRRNCAAEPGTGNCRARVGPGVAGHGARGHRSLSRRPHIPQLARRRFSSQPLSWPQAGQNRRASAWARCQGFIGKARLEGGAGHRAVVLPAG